MLSFVGFALAIACGTWLALLALQSVTHRLVRAAAPMIVLGGRIGAAAMVLPGLWLAVFIGAPLFGGAAIEILGSHAMRTGALLGVGVTQFVAVGLGGIVGSSLSSVYHRIACRLGASR